MIGLIADSLLLTLFASPLIFGLQRFGVWKPSLLMVLAIGIVVALLLQILFGQDKNFVVGYFIAIPLLLIGTAVLGASFYFGSRRRCPLCAERIRKEAAVCPYCRRDLVLQPAGDFPSTPKAHERPAAPSVLLGKTTEDDSLKPPPMKGIEELAKLPEAERRKRCWACNGKIPSCTVCKAREEKVREFLSSIDGTSAA